MGHSWNIIIFVFLLYITGSSAVTVLGFIGESAVLPCSISQDKIRDFKVHWRDDEGKSVFDIIGGNKTVEDQDLKYKNRVETFPDEQNKGNVSIKLNSLQEKDKRKYSCTITGPFQNVTYIELCVKDKPIGIGNHGGLLTVSQLTLTVSLLISFFFSTFYFVV